MSTEERLADINKRIAVATQEEARYAILRERAEENLREVMAALKEEFDISSIEDAKKLKISLEQQLAEEISKIEAQLDSLGA